MLSRNSSDFVIIGGVAAGPKTGAVLARRIPGASIVLFQREEFISYGSCGMPYYASGDINTFSDLTKTSYGVERSVDFFKNSKGFDVLLRSEVTAIDRTDKTVTVKDLVTGDTYKHGYGHCIIATGANPAPSPFPVAESPFIRHFTKPADALFFREKAQQGKIGSAIIVGAGYIGCEIAEATGVWGIETTLIECEPNILPGGLDPEMAALVQSELEKNNVTVLTGCAIQEIRLNGEHPEAVFSDRENLTADYVFLCLGVRPEVTLARESGLQIGTTGGIKVDSGMRTSDPAIFAGGDCVELLHQITGKPAFVPLGSLANRHGRIIAENLSGKTAGFPGVLGAALIKVCDKNIGMVGLSEQRARAEGFNAGCVWASCPDKPDYYPDSKEITVKLVYSKDNDRLLGLQAVGDGDVPRRIDVFSSMLQHKSTIHDLLDFEHGYAPPYSNALDPLHTCAAIAIAQKRGLALSPPPSDASFYSNIINSPDIIWLDVRHPDAFTENPWPAKDLNNRVNIPLNELAFGLKHLDPLKKYYIICARGARSYQSSIFLNNSGIKDIHVIAGGMAAL